MSLTFVRTVAGRELICAGLSPMSAAVRVAVRSDQYLDVAWSPTGGRVAVVVARGTGSALEVMRPDGTRLRTIMSADEAGSEIPDGGMSPTWSPTGTRLAFVARQGLFVVDADGHRRREIVNLPGLLANLSYPT